MKLHTSTTSPYVRKVLVCALERGISLERVPTKTSPSTPDAGLRHNNPLAKLPTLVLDDGTTLYDSPVICEYLDTLPGGARLLPERGAERFAVLRRQALADGILDAGVLVRYESLRPRDKQSEDWITAQVGKVTSGLDILESEAATFAPTPDVGTITVACALGWLEFRKPAGDIRRGRPRLFAWYDQFSKRPSLRDTEPHE
jgi:glutathione S-transferase